MLKRTKLRTRGSLKWNYPMPFKQQQKYLCLEVGVCEELMLYCNIVGAVIFGPFQVWQCSFLKFAMCLGDHTYTKIPFTRL